MHSIAAIRLGAHDTTKNFSDKAVFQKHSVFFELFGV